MGFEGSFGVRLLYTWRGLSYLDDIFFQFVIPKDDSLVNNEGFRRKT